MKNPFITQGIIAAGGSARSPGDIPLVRARTVSLTVRLTFGSSIDKDAIVYIYYSPDGKHWDTEEYTSFVIPYTAGATKQRTVIINMPEHGYFKVRIYNQSTADTITDVKAWYSIQSYPPGEGMQRGTITKDVGEE